MIYISKGLNKSPHFSVPSFVLCFKPVFEKESALLALSQCMKLLQEYPVEIVNGK